MFEASNKREASITLCLFPHLGEFIAVDTRTDLPDGPAVHVMSFEDIFTEEFRVSVEKGFSSIMRRDGTGLIEMIGLPQEVETLVRAAYTEDVGFHTIQHVEAAVRLYLSLRGRPNAYVPLAGLARWLAAHSPTPRAVRQTVVNAVRLQRGEAIHEE